MTPTTILQAEQAAVQHFSGGIDEARDHVRDAMDLLRPLAGSKLVGNGLRLGLLKALADFDKLDDHLQALLPMVDRYFNREDEG